MLSDIHNDATLMAETINDKQMIYNTLLDKYSKKLVDFTMFNLFEYICENNKLSIARDDKQFKKDVMARYGNKCVISGCPIMVCDICHIKPFAQCSESEKYDTNNGIILRTDLHKLFDDHKLLIHPDTHIVSLSDDIMNDINMFAYHCFNNIKINISHHSNHYLQLIY